MNINPNLPMPHIHVPRSSPHLYTLAIAIIGIVASILTQNVLGLVGFGILAYVCVVTICTPQGDNIDSQIVEIQTAIESLGQIRGEGKELLSQFQSTLKKIEKSLEKIAKAYENLVAKKNPQRQKNAAHILEQCSKLVHSMQKDSGKPVVKPT